MKMVCPADDSKNMRRRIPQLACSLHKDQIDIAFRALTPSYQGSKKDRPLDVVALKNRSPLPGNDLCIDVLGSPSSD
jgi:hypothetical protein